MVYYVKTYDVDYGTFTFPYFFTSYEAAEKYAKHMLEMYKDYTDYNIFSLRAYNNEVQ